MILALRLTVKSNPEQLPDRKLALQSVRFNTPLANTGDVYLANSYVSANDAEMRYALPAGVSEKLKLTNLAELWFSGTLDDYLYVIGEVEETK